MCFFAGRVSQYGVKHTRVLYVIWAMGVLCTAAYTYLYTRNDWKVKWFSKEACQNHSVKKWRRHQTSLQRKKFKQIQLTRRGDVPPIPGLKYGKVHISGQKFCAPCSLAEIWKNSYYRVQTLQAERWTKVLFTLYYSWTFYFFQETLSTYSHLRQGSQKHEKTAIGNHI